MRTGIAVIITNKKDQVLLMKRSPSARSDQRKWENPGGEVTSKEKPKNAAIREIKEELGVK